MYIVNSNNSETFKEKGLHIYNDSLLKNIMIPYSEGKLNIKSTIYIHNIETDKQYEIIDNPKKKAIMEKTLDKIFSIKYKEKPKEQWIKPKEKPKEAKEEITVYEYEDEEWKQPKKKGKMDKWV